MSLNFQNCEVNLLVDNKYKPDPSGAISTSVSDAALFFLETNQIHSISAIADISEFSFVAKLCRVQECVQ